MVDFIQRKLRAIQERSSAASDVLKRMRSRWRRPSLRSSSEFSDSETFGEISLPQLTINDVQYSPSELSIADCREVYQVDVQNQYKPIIEKVLKSRPTVLRYREEAENVFTCSEFCVEALDRHNELRSKHGVRPLVLSRPLCREAQSWANALAHREVFYHRNWEGVGESLLLKCTDISEVDANGEQVTDYWYGEIDAYDFSLDPELLHTQANQFSQLVWKDSQEFGIGKARSRGGKLIVVANYRPQGNLLDHFHENVFPAKDGADEGGEDIEEEEEEETTMSSGLPFALQKLRNFCLRFSGKDGD